MIPYVQVDAVAIGPFWIQPFGALVVLAGVVGWNLMMRRARALGLDMIEFRACCMWALALGAVMSHALDVVFYHPEDLARSPLTLLRLDNGLSSFGGFVGALLGGIAWRYIGWKKRGAASVPFLRRAPMPMLPFADVITPCFAISWCFGRLGCAIVHDHVSAIVPIGTPLAVSFPAPGEPAAFLLGPLRVWTHGSAPRYDLGLFELVFTMALSAALLATWNRTLAVGTRVAVVLIAYAPVRFAMDSLRDTGSEGDLRIAALTFAQWSSVAMLVAGAAMAIRARRAAA
jgi:phosphatidylglycerol:prolipoprotein diacylglycerol transferase